jgi:hypothetical protein
MQDLEIWAQAWQIRQKKKIILISYICLTPLRQMSYALKTMTLGQIVIAPSHWTKNFLYLMQTDI